MDPPPNAIDEGDCCVVVDKHQNVTVRQVGYECLQGKEAASSSRMFMCCVTSTTSQGPPSVGPVLPNLFWMCLIP